MTSKDLIEACDILIKLEQEFSTEEAKLSEISKEHAIKIDELDQQITTFRRNEDVDFRVFSPRNISTGTSDKIKALETEKKQLDREKRDADKQLKYYSGKTEMISKVLNILRGDLKEESEDDSITVKKSRNPFSFLDEDIEQQDEVIDDKKIDEVAALFKESDISIAGHENKEKELLCSHIHEIHTTELGMKRIQKNLQIYDVDVVDFLKNKILDLRSVTYRKGKNYYCEIDSIRITINSYNYCVITAHFINEK